MPSWRNISPRFSYVTSFKCLVSCSPYIPLWPHFFSSLVHLVFFPTLSRSIQQEKGVDLSANFMTTNFCFFYLLDAIVRRAIHSTKGQLISKAKFKVFIWTKNWTKIFFCISALASKMGQIKKIMAHYHAN